MREDEADDLLFKFRNDRKRNEKNLLQTFSLIKQQHAS